MTLINKGNYTLCDMSILQLSLYTWNVFDTTFVDTKLYNINLQQFASSDVSLQLIIPSHSCAAAIHVVPREQWNSLELQLSVHTESMLRVLVSVLRSSWIS